MIFLFEELAYQKEFLKKIISIAGDDDSKCVPNSFLEKVKGDKIKVGGVGFFYNPKCELDEKKVKPESVFVLPKVFIDLDGPGKSAFGIPIPDDKPFVIEDAELKEMKKVSKQFLSELSMWVCSSIAQYRRRKKNDSEVEAPDAHKYSRDHLCPNLFDVKNSMERFYEENESLFVFVSKNKHSGNNKINWQKTISKKTPFLQDGIPVYMELVNKKKVFDLDDRLLVLYFSAMHYISETFNFKMPKSEFYAPMRLNEFSLLLGHKGLMELRRIKHKYFADKFLKLYNIMEAFFEWGANFKANGCDSEYMLVSRYNPVFEDMIDYLVGESELPKQLKFLKNQRDGKDIDHLYKDQPLIFANKNDKIWFIGDSKYYSEGKKLRQSDIAKQFTYAKNIVQYNTFDSFYPDFSKNKDCVKYRDDLTEGYDVTPNFFIRGFLPKAKPVDEKIINAKDKYFRSFDADKPPKGATKEQIDNNCLIVQCNPKGFCVLDDDDKNVLEKKDDTFNLWDLRNRHFSNRLFDRDTLLLQVYNVNFLYVVKSYLSKRSGLREDFRNKAHNLFRDNFLQLLDEKYAFWIVFPKKTWSGADEVFLRMSEGMRDINDASLPLKSFVAKHGRVLAGKMFKPQNFTNCIIVALEQDFAKNDSSAGFWNAFEGDCETILPISPMELWDDAISVRESKRKKYDDAIVELRENGRCISFERLGEL